MRVIEDLLGAIERLPRAGEASTLDVCVGPFWTVVSTSVGAGIASTMAGAARPHEGLPVAEAGELHHRSPIELTRLLRSASTTEAAVGLAAVNALGIGPQGLGGTETALAVQIWG